MHCGVLMRYFMLSCKQIAAGTGGPAVIDIAIGPAAAAVAHKKRHTTVQRELVM